MEEDIWNWANGNKEAKEFVLKNCSRDGCSVRETEVAQFKRCGACHRVRQISQSLSVKSVVLMQTRILSPDFLLWPRVSKAALEESQTR